MDLTSHPSAVVSILPESSENLEDISGIQTEPNETSDNNSISVERKNSIVQWIPEQVCASEDVASQISSLYIHIHSNEFRGHANGKIGQEEAMMCDCSFDSCNFSSFLIISSRYPILCLWNGFRMY